MNKANQPLTASTMKAIQRKERVNKWMSVLLIYALFFQEFAPLARSMNAENWTLVASTSATFPDIAIDEVSVDLDNSTALTRSSSSSSKVNSSSQRIAMKMRGGPGQTESSGFSLGTTDGLVDKFSGDFSYSIPLMSVEGYPIVINYNSNVGMNSEASWVGLGWDLNVGSVSREMRGLPDEFNGNQRIVKTVNQLENITSNGKKRGGYLAYSSNAPLSIGKLQLHYPNIQLTALWGSYDNTYLGNGKTFDFGLQSGFSITEGIYFGPQFGFGFTRDSKNGVSRNGSFNLKVAHEGDVFSGGGGVTYAKSYNSRMGTTSRSIGLGANGTYSSRQTSGIDGIGVSTDLTYGSITSIPSISHSGEGKSLRVGFDLFTEINKGGRWKVGFLLQNYSSSNNLLYGNENFAALQKIEHEAFGYLHSGKRVATGKEDNLALMDFNRTNDSQFSSEMKNLPFSFQTYDIFRASALGISGTFRAHRSDVGTYFDPNGTNTNSGNTHDIDLGLVIGSGAPKLKLGYSYGEQNGDAESGNWENASFTSNGGNILTFNEELDGNDFDQSVSFKALGESTPANLAQFNLLGGSRIAYLDVNKSSNNDEIAQSNYLKVGGAILGGVSTGSWVSAQTVNAAGGLTPFESTVFEPKTAGQAAQESVFYRSRKEGEYVTSGVDPLNRIGNYRDANHLSQIDVLSADGMHYTYGIPTYDVETNQVSFAVGNTPGNNDARPVDAGTNLVRYSSPDNSIDNLRGRGHYYDKTRVPGYAHSFLLTEMRSSDYVDLGEQGLSVNDIGSYYKFNHTQYYGQTNVDPNNPSNGKNGRTVGNYKWRFPISDDMGRQAMHNEGFEGTDLDDMANYTYGEKEIWYTHSVESKNFIAEFYLEDRVDAYGVLDENGKIDVNAPLKRLKKIVLYNRAERSKSGNAAIPLQTVEFYYDYSLCKNSPGNKHTYSANSEVSKSGKLTLTEIRVYAGNSKEGGLSKYRFDYSTVNPDFNYAATDGWGNYKPNSTAQPNTIFPYAEQDKTIADQNSKAWKLVAINNPMGGRVEIDYEADQYVSVQDKRTMKHLDVGGMTNLIEFLALYNTSSWDFSSSPYVYDEFNKEFTKTGLETFINSNYIGSDFNGFYNETFTLGGFTPYTAKFGQLDLDFVPNNVMIFRLDEPLDVTNYTSKDIAGAFVKEAYFKNSDEPNDYMEEVLFKAHVNVKVDNGLDIEEYIPTFAKISDDFVLPFGSLLGLTGNAFAAVGVMPPSASGQYEYGYVIVDPSNTGAREHKNNKGDDKGGVLVHPIQRAALDFVRQNLPDKVYGSCDGCDSDLSIDGATFWTGDVTKVMIKAGYVASFDHDYTTMRLFVADSVKFGGNARVSKITYKDNWNVSSGEYASEYSWIYNYSSARIETGVASYEPQAIIDECAFYNWDTYVNEAQKFPDESRFTPTPVTGALFPIPLVGYADVRVYFGGAYDYGYSKSEFYTASDYPTEEIVAPIDKSHVNKRNIVTGNSVDLYGFAQGFVIETNDFHGKPKQFAVYDVLDNLQSRSTYHYNELDEKISMINRSGEITKENIAMEYDFHVDSRFASNVSKSFSLGLTFKISLITFLPTIPMPTFHLQKREEGFFSSAFVKHINRSAVVKSIETEYLNSINTAENLLYDKYTGNVLLSSLKDEYEDKLYSMSYPSHWYEPQLRDVNSATNKRFLSMNIAGSTLTLTPTSEATFAEGDQLDISLSNTLGGAPSVAWILSITGNTASLINANGLPYNGISGTVDVRIKKSGRQNRLSETMQSVTTKRPILVPPAGGAFVFPEVEILSSSAISYRNKNNIRCRAELGDEKHNNEVLLGSTINPFAYGIKGDLVLDGQFAWQAERSNATHQHGTRFDGAYADFIPFYKLGTDAKWHKIDEQYHPNLSTVGDLQKWRKLGEVTRYDEYGKAVESQDQIRVHSSVLYGFNRELALLPVAQAVNARQQEIAYDGFEDYGYYSTSPLNNEETHFDFADALVVNVIQLNNDIRHSGLSSLELDPGANAIVTKEIASVCDEPTSPSGGAEFIAEECLCVIPFEPTAGDYVIGAWVKVGDDRDVTQYIGARMEVAIAGQPAILIYPTGPILDGWQRMEGEFTVLPSSVGAISVSLRNSTAADQVYFDDLRIHPFLAGMTTTVYDPKTLLPLATHDGYNFTTYFNYDENLNQVRVRVETVDGIKTISESEFGGQKYFILPNQ